MICSTCNQPLTGCRCGPERFLRGGVFDPSRHSGRQPDSLGSRAGRREPVLDGHGEAAGTKQGLSLCGGVPAAKPDRRKNIWLRWWLKYEWSECMELIRRIRYSQDETQAILDEMARMDITEKAIKAMLLHGEEGGSNAERRD